MSDDPFKEVDDQMQESNQFSEKAQRLRKSKEPIFRFYQIVMEHRCPDCTATIQPCPSPEKDTIACVCVRCRPMRVFSYKTNLTEYDL